MTQPFQYDLPKSGARIDRVDRLETPAADEFFTGQVKGLPASDIEERSANYLDRRGVDYEFRPVYVAGRNLPGSVELDFLVYIGDVMQPVQIDGEFAHFTANQRAEDRTKDAYLNDQLRGSGAFPVIRIPQKRGEKTYLETPAQVAVTWDRVLAGDIGDFIDA
jgi:hypothetical protein